MTTTPSYLTAPLYYVRHDDAPEPGATTCAYPLAALLGTLTEVERGDYAGAVSSASSFGPTVGQLEPRSGVTWQAEQYATPPEYADPELGGDLELVNTGGVVRAGWLLSDFPADAITMTWRTPSTRGPWRKRTERPDDGFAGTMWDSAPDEPSEELARRMSHYDWDEDPEAVLGTKVYARDDVPGYERSHRFDVTGWKVLPTRTDPERAYEVSVRNRWKVDDPSLLAIYGQHTAHLWPGRLLGLGTAVRDALKAHPQVANGGTVYDHSLEREGKLSVSYTWRFDNPRDRTSYTLGKGKGRRKDPRTGMYAKTERTTTGQLRHIERKVPGAVIGESLAAALERWDEVVAVNRRHFLPDDDEVLGCAACGAQGWTTKAEAGTDRDVVRLASELGAELTDPEHMLTTGDLVLRTEALIDAVLGTPVVGHGRD